MQTAEIVHLLWTIFSGGLVHIWCFSEYLGQQDGVCGIESKYTTQCVFMAMNEHVSVCNIIVHWCVLNSFLTTMELYGLEKEDMSRCVYTESDFAKLRNKQFHAYTRWKPHNVVSTACIASSRKWKISNFSGEFTWRCVATANQQWDSLDITDISTSWRQSTESDIPVKNTVCEYTEQFNTTVYTAGWCHEHRKKMPLSFSVFLGLP